MRRLAPADFATAVSASQVRRDRARKGLAHDRSERALRDGDVHKIFKAGRELAFVRGDGSVEVRTLKAAEAKNARVLIGVVKLLLASEPSKVIRDATIAEKLGGKQAGWSLSTVRRTRRVCAAAGIDVAPVVSDGAEGIAAPEFTGFRWTLDRRTVACLNIGVVTAGPLYRVHERENPVEQALPAPETAADAGRAPPAAAVSDEGEGLTTATDPAVPPLAPLEPPDEHRPRRRWSRRSREPSTAEVGEEVALLLRLLKGRWKVTDAWGLAPALSAAEDDAIAAGADPRRVAVARRRLAFELMGEQLRLEGAEGAEGGS